jgi:hypothetical protein
MEGNFPCEKVIMESLLAISAIGSELSGDLVVEKVRELLHGRSKIDNLRPAGCGGNETGKFPQEMIVRAGAR